MKGEQRTKLISTEGDWAAAALYTLPPEVMPGNDESELYPACFEANPSMPTSFLNRKKNGRMIVEVLYYIKIVCISVILVINSLQEIVINKTTPRDVTGKIYQPYWFSEGNSIIPKKELMPQIEKVPAQQENLNSPAKTSSSSSTEPLIVERENGENKNLSVQRWIQAQPPKESDSDSSDFCFDHPEQRLVPVKTLFSDHSTREIQNLATQAAQNNQPFTSRIAQSVGDHRTSSSSSRNNATQRKNSPSCASVSSSLSKEIDGDECARSKNDVTPSKDSRSSKRKEESLADLSDQIDEPSVRTRTQKQAMKSASPPSPAFQEESGSSPRRTRKRTLSQQSGSHKSSGTNNRGLDSQLSTESTDKKKVQSKGVDASSQSSTYDSDLEVKPPSSKKKTTRLSSSDSDGEVEMQGISTPIASESPSNYDTPEQGTLNSQEDFQTGSQLPVFSEENVSTKRQLFTADVPMSPKGKPVSHFNGNRKLANLMTVLHEHSEKLCIESEEAAVHGHELKKCLDRIKNHTNI